MTIDLSQHPSWYYRRYDEVFGRGASYESDIRALRTVVETRDRRVQEIGAGSGEHAARLLTAEPRSLELVDYDSTACELLRRRFVAEPRVLVLNANGFQAGASGSHDVVLAMYSIALQLSTEDELRHALMAIWGRVSNGGSIAFEIIDVERSRSVYPSGARTEIYKEKNRYLQVWSEYGADRFTVNYGGRIEQDTISYSVSLLARTEAQYARLASEISGGTAKVQCVPLDRVERRVLVVASKFVR